MATWKKILQHRPKADDLANSPSADLVLKTNGTTTSWATVTSAATGTVSEVSAGTGLSVSNGTTTPTITLSLDDLMDKTNAVDPSEDELLIIDNSSTMPTVAKRKLISEIRLSTFSIADSVAPTSGSNAISTGGQVHSFVTGLPISTFTNDSGFTDDQTGAEISTALFAESDTNNLTDALKTKLDGIATGAEVNVQSDWDSSSGDSQILNKPTIPVDLTVNGAGTVHANNYTNTTYADFDNDNGGLVPSPESTGTTTKYLREDGDWVIPPDTNTTYTAGTGLQLSGTTFSWDLTGLTDMTQEVDGSQDELVVMDNGSHKRKLLSEIRLSAFDNDSSWTDNAGTITRVRLVGDDASTATVTSGNADMTIAGGDTLSTVASGSTLTISQSHFYHQEIHSWYANSASAYYIPFGPSSLETAAVTDAWNDDTLFIVPFDGKLEKIVVQCATGVGLPAGSTDISLRVNGTNQTAVNQTIANETTATYTWSANNTFSAGDRIRIEFDSAVAAKYATATSVWKFEL
ncbi:MAG: hypothetical protein Unbinned5179contig1000_30 [Prokaryotic dsDNA virus sp.]|nr:MAG: hypothetical protein Unbinned5179contig1000_30 [Prokaryotic dsDNA virus sp.]